METEDFIADMMIEHTVEQAGTTYRVLRRKQNKRNSMVVLMMGSEETSHKLVQKCQIVVKDGLPPWAAMIIMKQITMEILARSTKVDDLKPRRGRPQRLPWDMGADDG